MKKCNGGGCAYKSNNICCIDCEDRKSNTCNVVCNIVKYSKPFECEECEECEEFEYINKGDC